LRNTILREAHGMIRDGGVDAFALRECARRAGVSPNAAYRHFADKAAVLAALRVEGFSVLAGQLRERIDRTPKPRGGNDGDLAMARLLGAAAAYIDFAVENESVFRVMFAAGAKSQGASGEHNAEGVLSIFEECISAVAAAGLLAQQLTGAEPREVWAMIHGFTVLALESAPGLTTAPERSAALASVFAFLLRGLGVVEAAPQARTGAARGKRGQQ
jgi:AcrR family transcriptional regulator